MINKVILVGHVGADPTIRLIDRGGVSIKVATIRLATTEKWRDKNGQPQEETQWHNLVLWRQNAAFAEKYVKKGGKLYVEGKITYRKYTANDGTERYVTEIQVTNITLLDKKQDGAQAPAAPAQAEYPAPDTETPPADAQPADGDPDMPF